MSLSDDQAFAHEVYKCYQKLTKNGKPQSHEYTVLAAIAVSLNRLDTVPKNTAQKYRVVALATGTKCLGGSSRSKTGDLLNDSHAEALTRRAFCSWLQTELQLAVQQYKTQLVQQGQPLDSNDQSFLPHPVLSNKKPRIEPCFEFDAETKKFRLCPGIQLHMYISQPPCGDACIVQMEKAAQDDTQSNTQQHACMSSQTLHVTPPPNCHDMSHNQYAEHVATQQPTSQPAGNMVSTMQGGFTTNEPQIKLRTGAKALRLLPEAIKDIPGHLPQNHTQQIQQPLLSTAQDTLVGKQPTLLGHQTATGFQQADIQQSMVLDGNSISVTLNNSKSDSHICISHTVASLSSCETAKAVVTPSQTGVDDANSHVSARKVYVPQAGDVEVGPQECGVLRRKPGKGDATLSLSCSDKLARWACCGLQGSLLAGLLVEPIYLSTLNVAKTEELAKAGPDVQEAARQAVVRAVGGRLQGVVEHCLTHPYRLCVPRVGQVDPPPADLGLCPSPQRKVGAGSSINWSASPGTTLPALMNEGDKVPTYTGTQEVTVGSEGHKAGAKKSVVAAGKARSRICRFNMAQAVMQLLDDIHQAEMPLPETCVGILTNKQLVESVTDAQKETVEPSCDKNTTGNASIGRDEIVNERHKVQYKDLKLALGTAYLNTWNELKQTSPFHMWIEKPAELQQFEL